MTAVADGFDDERTVAAKRSASAMETARPWASALAGLGGLPSLLAEVLREAG
jgi:hypothetical protein